MRGFLVFYNSGEELYAAIIKNTPNKWEVITKSGPASIQSSDGLSAIFSTRFSKGEKILYFSYGVISNPDIIEVKSMAEDETISAKIIQTEEGIKIWFVTYTELIDTTLPSIIGLSKEGEILLDTNE